MRPAISVVVVTWNAPHELAGCLAALRAQRDAEFELVVVDNGSHPPCAAEVRGCWPGARVVALAENVGFAEACNRGIEAASAEWIALLNDDARPDPGWLAALDRASRGAPDSVGMLQSPVVRLDAPDRVASAGVRLGSDGVFQERGRNAPARALEAAAIFCPTAAAALYRRTLLERLRLPSGIFDRGFFAYFEDVDLGWRARLAGFEARLVPDAFVKHAEHASARRQPDGFLDRQCRRNRVRTLLKNASWRFVARALPRLARDAAAELRWGPGELVRWMAAGADGLQQRPAVGRLARVPRRAVEAAWAEPPGGRAPEPIPTAEADALSGSREGGR